MDWNLSLHGQTPYRVCQFTSGLIIALGILIAPGAAAWFSLGLELAAVFLLGSVSRILGGIVAGATNLILVSLYASLVELSFAEAISFFCLATLIWFLATRNWTRKAADFPLPLELAALLAVGCCVHLSFLVLAPVVGFAYLLLRYVPSDSIRPYQTLWDSLRTHPAMGLRDLLIIAIGPTMSLVPFWAYDRERIHSAANASRLVLRYPGWPTNLHSVLAPFSILVLIGFSVTLWWLFVSIQSGSGLPFSLTAIPVTYLFAGALTFNNSVQYAMPVHLILVANLVAFLGLWWRGRTNKRVLDSTGN